MHSRAQVSGASATCFNRPAQQATEPQAERSDVCSLSWSGGRVNIRAVRTSPLHGEFEQLLLACSEGCGLHHNRKVRCCFHLRMRTVLTGSPLYMYIAWMLLVVFSHIIP